MKVNLNLSKIKLTQINYINAVAELDEIKYEYSLELNDEFKNLSWFKKKFYKNFNSSNPSLNDFFPFIFLDFDDEINTTRIRYEEINYLLNLLDNIKEMQGKDVTLEMQDFDFSYLLTYIEEV